MLSKARIVGFASFVLLLLLTFSWLILDHPPKNVEFTTATLEYAHADLRSEKGKGFDDILFLQFIGTEIEIRPSTYFYVSEQFVVYDFTRPARMPILLQLQTTAETAERLSGNSMSAQQIVFTSLKPVRLRLQSQSNLSLQFDKTGTYTALYFILENFSEEDRTVHVEPTHVSQDLSISIDGREPINIELVDWPPWETVTIILGGDEASLTESGVIPWAGLFSLSRDPLSVTFDQSKRPSNGVFRFSPADGHMAIGDKPRVPMERSYLIADFSDKVGFTFDESSGVVNGEAQVIASSTSEQMLPSRWSDLPQVGQILIGVISPLLAAAGLYLLRPPQPGIKLSNLYLAEWTTDNPKIEFRATNHKKESIKIECFGLMMPGGQEFPPYAPPPESIIVPGRDYRIFTIPIKHVKELYRPEVRSTFKFVFVKDTTGRSYKMRIPSGIVREIAA